MLASQATRLQSPQAKGSSACGERFLSFFVDLLTHLLLRGFDVFVVSLPRFEDGLRVVFEL